MCNIIHSNIDKEGIENIVICTGKSCNISLQGWCTGDFICFENDHKKQVVTIYKGMHYPAVIKKIKKIKDEVWTEKECVDYIKNNGILINSELICKNNQHNERSF